MHKNVVFSEKSPKKPTGVFFSVSFFGLFWEICTSALWWRRCWSAIGEIRAYTQALRKLRMFEQLCSITVRRYNVIPDPKHLLFVQIKTPKNLNWSPIFVFVVWITLGNWQRSYLSIGDVLRLYTACVMQEPRLDWKESMWNIAVQIKTPEKQHEK